MVRFCAKQQIEKLKNSVNSSVDFISDMFVIPVVTSSVVEMQSGICFWFDYGSNLLYLTHSKNKECVNEAFQ